MSVDPTTVPIAGDEAQYPEQSYVPTAATRVTPTTNNTPVTALFHRTAFLRKLLLKDPIYLDMPAGLPNPLSSPTARFQYAGGGAILRSGWIQTDVADPGAIIWGLKLPLKARLTGTTAYVLAEPVTLGSLPATMPRLQTRVQPTDGGDGVLENEQIDPSPNVAAFNAFHAIGGAWVASPTLLAGDVLEFTFNGMQGGGALASGLKLVAIKIDIEPIVS